MTGSSQAGGLPVFMYTRFRPVRTRQLLSSFLFNFIRIAKILNHSPPSFQHFTLLLDKTV